MTATQVFYTTIPESGAFTFPEEFRGKPLKIVVEEESAKSPVQDLVDYCTKSASLCTDEELDNDRYEYLKEKYRLNEYCLIPM
jgi:hypothetical protein